MSSEKMPHVCEPSDQSSGRPATFIFLHGYADDGEGLPLGMAQQFQWYSKLPYLRWVLPHAPIHPEARERAWYLPKALPNALKPRVPGQEEQEIDQERDPDDEEGIMESVTRIDQLVRAELDRGVDASRIIIGGFSQGCAMSLVWGLTGETRSQVAGMFCMAGYFPLGSRISILRDRRGYTKEPQKDQEKKKWLYVHGSRDQLVPGRLFEHGQQELKKWVREEDVQAVMYEGMGHSSSPAQLRDLLHWLEKVIPP